MKFALVLSTLTCTVEEASVRARVKRPHITPSKMRFRAKKNCATSVSEEREHESSERGAREQQKRRVGRYWRRYACQTYSADETLDHFTGFVEAEEGGEACGPFAG